MASFFFKAVDVNDRTIQGIMEAPTLHVAQVRVGKIFKKTLVLRAEEKVQLTTHERGGITVKTEALSVYTRQFASMIQSGISINRALRFLTQGDDQHMNLVSGRLSESVQEGNSLSKAMAEQPGCFGDIYLALVRAGEKSGRLEAALLKLADLMEKGVKLKKRIISTFAYPSVIGLVCLANAFLFMFYIMPLMLPMFTSMGVALPWPTIVVMQLTEFLHSKSFLVLAILVFLGGANMARTILRGTNHYWFTLHLLRVPLFGDLLKMSSSARVLYTLATLLDSGVGLVEAMLTASEVAGNVVLTQKMVAARATLLDGFTLHGALAHHDVFPRTALQMIKVGEETGKVAELVRRLAKLYEDDVDLQLDRIASLIEPVIMGVMGALVAFAVLATFLPIISLIQQF